MTQLLGFLAVPFGFAMRWMYQLFNNYGWTIIVATVIIRILMFPLSMKQQKSQARMAAFQPMIQEIQKKWGNDKNRANEEVMKFQQENGMKATDGCLPMIVNMVVLFSIIVVIQAPLNYMLNLPAQQIQNGVAIVQYYDPESNISSNTFTQESILIGEIIENPEIFTEGYMDIKVGEDGTETETHVYMDQEYVDAVKEFQFNFMGMNLAIVPSFERLQYIILPILSIITMFGSQVIVMLTSGQKNMGKTMWITSIAMGVFFGYYAFTVPVGFSLYYTASNVVMTLQQLIVRKIYNPEKIKEDIILEIEEKKKSKKAKKQVTIKDESGEVVTKEFSDAELARVRLAKAREMDAEKYGEDEEDAKKLDEALKQDEERYKTNQRIEDDGITDVEEDELEPVKDETDVVTEEKDDTIEEKQSGGEAQPAKAGRRKRATQKKKTDEKSFAEQEREEEAKNEAGEG